MLVALIFRVNAIFLFLSLAVGELLVRYIGDDAVLAVNMFSRAELTAPIVRLTLLLFPLVLTLVFLKKTMPRSKVVLQLLPLWVIGLAVASLAITYMPDAMAKEILALPAGGVLNQSQNLVVALAAVLAFLLAVHEHRFRGKHHLKHK